MSVLHNCTSLPPSVLYNHNGQSRVQGGGEGEKLHLWSTQCVTFLLKDMDLPEKDIMDDAEAV